MPVTHDQIRGAYGEDSNAQRGARTDRSARGEGEASRRMVERMKAEQARAAEENQRLTRELDALRARARVERGARRRAVGAEGRARRHPRRASARCSSSSRRSTSESSDSCRTPRHPGRDPRTALPDPQHARSGVRGAAGDATSTRRCARPPTRRRPATRCAWPCSPRSTSPTSCSAAATPTRARDGELAERAGELERLLDRVLLA